MTALRFGYNTNGFAHHRLEDALVILRRLGYRSVAITLDHHALNPFEPRELRGQLRSMEPLLTPLRRGSAIETGSRFLLDPWRKHQPTLISRRPADRVRRLDFLRAAVDIAARLGVECVSFWSGTADSDEPRDKLLRRLADGCRRLADHAARNNVRLAFEPEPGMLIDTMARFAELAEVVDHPAFGLTLDLGHLHCQGETPIEAHVTEWSDRLWNVHIEDMKRGTHDHLMFGEGEMAFPPILRSLIDAGYSGGVHVELSRHSHQAVETARAALAFLKQATQ